MTKKTSRPTFKVLAVLLFLAPVIFFAASAHADSFEAKGKNWDAKLHTLYARDDNVVQTPRNAALRPSDLVGTGDSSVNVGGSAKYTHRVSNKLTVAAEYDIDAEVYTQLNDYNLVSQVFGVRPVYKLNPLVRMDFSYRYIWNINAGENFSGIHYLGPSFSYMHKKFGLTRLHYTFKKTNNFMNDGRDNDQHSAGIAHYFFFANYTRRIGVTYQFTTDNTASDTFDRDLHDISIKAKIPIYFGFILDAEGKISFRDYRKDSAIFGKDRSDDRQRYTAKLTKVLIKKWRFIRDLTLEGQYRYTFNNSSVGFREYKSNRFVIGLRAKF